MNATVIMDIVVLEVKNMWADEEFVENHHKFAEVAEHEASQAQELHSEQHHVVT